MGWGGCGGCSSSCARRAGGRPVPLSGRRQCGARCGAQHCGTLLVPCCLCRLAGLAGGQAGVGDALLRV